MSTCRARYAMALATTGRLWRFITRASRLPRSWICRSRRRWSSSPRCRRSPGTCAPWSTWGSDTYASVSLRRLFPAARHSASSWPASCRSEPPDELCTSWTSRQRGCTSKTCKLLGVLGRLVDAGNTVVVIEHNLDVIKTADWLIDMGPEGGLRGGLIIAEGTPEQVAANTKSYTGAFLKPLLDGQAVPIRATQPALVPAATPTDKVVSNKLSARRTAAKA